MSKKIKLVVCNEPQNCGTVKELEAEVMRLTTERDKLMPDGSMLAGHSGILDRETAWQLTYATCKERAEKAEARVAATQKLIEKWRREADILNATGIDYDSEQARGIFDCADELEKALGVGETEG